MPKSLFVNPDEVRAKSELQFSPIPVNAYEKTVSQEKENFRDEDFVRIYRDMTVLREFESMLNQIKTQGVYSGIETTYPGPAHLSMGQEAAAVGEAYLLAKDDFTFGSHRSHSEILAKSLSCIEKLPDNELLDIMESFLDGKTLRAVEKGGKATDVKSLAVEFVLYGALAEIFARETGFHKGLGGSMHAFFLPSVCTEQRHRRGSARLRPVPRCITKQPAKTCGRLQYRDGSLGCAGWESLNFAAMIQFEHCGKRIKTAGYAEFSPIIDNAYGMGGQTRGETWRTICSAHRCRDIAHTLHAESLTGLTRGGYRRVSAQVGYPERRADPYCLMS
jgi:2-oxoisovalerate dehydrogenase E1 component